MEGKRNREDPRQRVSRQKSCIGLGLWWLPQSAQDNERETGSYTEVPVTPSSKTRSQCPGRIQSCLSELSTLSSCCYRDVDVTTFWVAGLLKRHSVLIPKVLYSSELFLNCRQKLHYCNFPAGGCICEKYVKQWRHDSIVTQPDYATVKT